MTYCIQRKDARYLETVDEFTNRREALELWDALESENVENAKDFADILRQRDDALQKSEDLRYELSELRAKLSDLEESE